MAKKETAHKARTVTGIEYGKRLVRIATLSVNRSGKISLKGLTQAHAPHGRRGVTEDLLAGRRAALKEALSKHPKDLGDVIVGVPREDVITRLVSLPSGDPEEVREMLFFDVERYLPFPPDEAEISYRIIEQIGANESRVLMVAARRNELYQIIEELDEAGLEPLRLDVDVHGCAYAFTRSEGERDGEPFAVFHLDNQSSLIGLIVDHQLRFSRTAPIATDDLESGSLGISFEKPPMDWTEDQNQWWAGLVRNLKRSITGFAHEPMGTMPKYVVFSGPGSEIPGLKDAIENEISIPVTQRLPINPGKSNEPLLFYSSPNGLAREEIHNTHHFNLVPEEIYHERAAARRKQFLVNSVILLIFNLLLLGGWVGHSVWNKKQLAGIYQSKILAIQPQIKDIDVIDKKLKVINQNIDRQNSAFKVLSDLFERTPDKVKITQLTFKKSDSVVMNLETYTGADMDAYVKILGDSPYFAGTIERGRLETKDLSRMRGEYDIPNYQQVTGTTAILRTNPKLQE